MAVTASTTVPAPLDQVVVTCTDEEFIQHVTHRAGATLESVEVVGDVGARCALTTVRNMATDRLPGTARKFVGEQVAEAAEPFIGRALSLQSREAEAWLASR